MGSDRDAHAVHVCEENVTFVRERVYNGIGGLSIGFFGALFLHDDCATIIGMKTMRDPTQRHSDLEQLNQELKARVAQRTSELAVANAELQRISQLQQAILNSANYLIVSTDAEGVVRTFNAAAERMLGYAAEEVIGRVTPVLFHDAGEVAERARMLATMGQAVESPFDALVAGARAGFASEHETMLVRRDGSRFPALLSVSPLPRCGPARRSAFWVLRATSAHATGSRPCSRERRAVPHVGRSFAAGRGHLPGWAHRVCQSGHGGDHGLCGGRTPRTGTQGSHAAGSRRGSAAGLSERGRGRRPIGHTASLADAIRAQGRARSGG